MHFLAIFILNLRFTFEELEETYDGIIPKSNTWFFFLMSFTHAVYSLTCIIEKQQNSHNF